MVLGPRCTPLPERESTRPSKPSAYRESRNVVFAATSAVPNLMWFRRVATAATRYTPTGNNPHTKKPGVNARSPKSARPGPRPPAAALDVCGPVRTRPPARSACKTGQPVPFSENVPHGAPYAAATAAWASCASPMRAGIVEVRPALAPRASSSGEPHASDSREPLDPFRRVEPAVAQLDQPLGFQGYSHGSRVSSVVGSRDSAPRGFGPWSTSYVRPTSGPTSGRAPRPCAVGTGRTASCLNGLGEPAPHEHPLAHVSSVRQDHCPTDLLGAVCGRAGSDRVPHSWSRGSRRWFHGRAMRVCDGAGPSVHQNPPPLEQVREPGSPEASRAGGHPEAGRKPCGTAAIPCAV